MVYCMRGCLSMFPGGQMEFSRQVFLTLRMTDMSLCTVLQQFDALSELLHCHCVTDFGFEKVLK